jgi:thiol-disulfide isomerase/thioredoxin
MSVFSRVHLPPLDGATAWVNSEPLSAEALRGRVLVVNFWTLTCINWLRQEPYVRAWADAYREDGLVVLGVHTPEFSFEHDADRVRRAVADRAIGYPVAVDSDYAIWRAFANRYWPALYFADATGIIRHEHFGEGRYEECERVIQQLLGVVRALVGVAGEGVEAAADWDHQHTPETYLGPLRGHGFASPGGSVFDEPRDYALPDRLPGNQWALAGTWEIGPERVALSAAGGRVAFRFHARDAHVVLANGTGASIPFRVVLDGEPPGDSHGDDVAADGSGTLDDGRLYQVVRQAGPVRERTLEIAFDAAGAEAYAFTFG